MLENRSFDHMLGFSGISGTDAVSGRPTSINGLTLATTSLLQLARSWQRNTVSGIVARQGGKWPPPPAISVRGLLTSSISNTFNGQSYSVTQPAHYAMPVGPGHEFPDVLEQLCGPGVSYSAPYPPIVNSGYVTSYAKAGGQSNLGEIMKCYSTPSQLPVLNKLAQEFVVCDNWYASMPGPTWPNRFFAHAASSGGLDHSPNWIETLAFQGGGFSFENGTIFDRMDSNSIKWQLYAGDNFPQVAALDGIDQTDINDYHDFAPDVAQAGYLASYTFIEPGYGDIWFGTFKCGTSQHPVDDVTRGESLIKATYEAIRNSPLWNSSLLIITWDEHGGFYDHAPPPQNDAVAPGDTEQYNRYGFTFQQYGPRVPAVVISPLIPRNLIDHRVYDHASIPATLEACFGLKPMTQRDANATNLMSLVSLSSPRSDAPVALPSPAQSGFTDCDPVSLERPIAPAPSEVPMKEGIPAARSQDSIDEETLPGFLLVALRFDLALSPPEQRAGIMARFNTIKTRADAATYSNEVGPKVRAARNALRGRPSLT